MLKSDIDYVFCMKCLSSLEYGENCFVEGDQVLEGTLFCKQCQLSYPIDKGIPRFIQGDYKNPTWSYKWEKIDQGVGVNYKILNKGTYDYHWNLFIKNDYDGEAFKDLEDSVILDVGCGIGQYSLFLLENRNIKKLIALDYTSAGPEIFLEKIKKDYPQFLDKVLIIQASVFEMPFKKNSLDYVFSFGVLHHTGNTKKAIAECASIVKENGNLNFWVYPCISVNHDNSEKGRGRKKLYETIRAIYYNTVINFWKELFRILPHTFSVAIIYFFSMKFWYWMVKTPVLNVLTEVVFPSVNSPDFRTRFINNYDGYCNTWAEAWDESELFPVLKDNDIVIKGIAESRLGIWGVKKSDFY